MRRPLGPMILVILAFIRPSLALTPGGACDDKIPDPCKDPQFLGQDKGCACFECNPNTPTAQTVCTRDDAKKKALFDKVKQ